MTRDDNQTSDSFTNPAPTTHPTTELILGKQGVRILHYLTYGLVFVGAFALTLPLYASLRTLVILVSSSFSFLQSIWQSGAPVEYANMAATTLFIESITNAGVIIGALITGVLACGIVFIWNEIRYKRGEWLRTYL